VASLQTVRFPVRNILLGPRFVKVREWPYRRTVQDQLPRFLLSATEYQVLSMHHNIELNCRPVGFAVAQFPEPAPLVPGYLPAVSSNALLLGS